MVIVKEGLRGKNPEAKVTYGSKVNEKMTGNVNFPDAAAVLDALGKATDNLDKAIKDPNGTATKVNSMAIAFNVKMKAVVAHVQGVINEVADDVALEMVVSAGLTAAKQGSINIPDLSATQGKEAKSVKVRRKREKKTVTYVFQMCLDTALETNWKNCKISSRAKVIITDLISGLRYYFRVAIIRGDVQEDFSDFISIVVD